jgi:hypothetical protein
MWASSSPPPPEDPKVTTRDKPSSDIPTVIQRRGEAGAPGSSGGGALTRGIGLQHDPVIKDADALEWYFGVQGQPIGPISRREVRDRLGIGELDAATLTWREGMDNWIPLERIGELRAILDMIRVQRDLSSSSRPPLPETGLGAQASGLASFAPGPSPSGLGAGASPGRLGTISLAPNASGETGTLTLTPEALAQIASMMPRQKQQRGTNAWAIVFWVTAVAFAGVVAWFATRPKPQALPGERVVVEREIVHVIEGSQPPPPPTDSIGGAVPSNTGNGQAGARTPGGGTTTPATTEAGGKPAAPMDTSSFLGIAGPSVGGPASGGPGASGLSGAEAEGVIARNKPLVSRRCWDPVLQTATAATPKSARVDALITVGADGRVQSVTATGGERDFPGLARCVSDRVRSWQFPASGGSSTFKAPFVFARQ